MVYKSYTIESSSEILIGLLSAFPFESFEERENQIVGYISEEALDDDLISIIHTTINGFGVDYTVEDIQPQNWNALWESSFDPVRIDNFCMVRADFHDADSKVKHDIIINPKLAFGTGHHETTYMMISAMEGLDMGSKSVFDYGCGTGVLAVLASKLDSDPIDAIDIENESYENTIENAN